MVSDGYDYGDGDAGHDDDDDPGDDDDDDDEIIMICQCSRWICLGIAFG